jgi:isopentenyl-diphosphate delta-isomerase
MENPNQILVTVDKQGKTIGIASRKDCHKGEGICHLAFAAFIKNKKGEILLAKRSQKKSLWGGHWDASVVSHVLPGETVEEAAKRRGVEELGVEVDFVNLGGFFYHKKFGEGSENEYCHILIGESDKKPKMDLTETEEICWVSKEELLKRAKFDPLITPWVVFGIKKFKDEI